ncbi:hypothetical protein SUGI_0887880 [Cryptomeria japonica]|nr:hypothetical protein SUGI_0887880 [Cryptomeria japonica]
MIAKVLANRLPCSVYKLQLIDGKGEVEGSNEGGKLLDDISLDVALSMPYAIEEPLPQVFEIIIKHLCGLGRQP